MSGDTPISDKKTWARTVTNGYTDFATRMMVLLPNLSLEEKLAIEEERDTTVDYWNTLFLMLTKSDMTSVFDDKSLSNIVVTTEFAEDVIESQQRNNQHVYTDYDRNAVISSKQRYC